MSCPWAWPGAWPEAGLAEKQPEHSCDSGRGNDAQFLRLDARRGSGGIYAASRDTLSDRRRFSAIQRSYCTCWFNQLSALVSNAIDRRTAISGLMAARPLIMDESVFRLTPRALAVSVTESPRGSRHKARRISPGWGGLCIATGMSVIVLVVDVGGILTGKRESPGRSMSFGAVEAARRARTNRNRSACSGRMPDFAPDEKNRSNPRWRKHRITFEV